MLANCDMMIHKNSERQGSGLYKVLIAESSEMLRAELERKLCGNCSIYIRRDYENILTLAEQQRPDLVIVDLMQPGVDGVEVLQRLHLLSPRPEILATSRYLSGYAMTKVMSLGADYVMIKPCDADQIVERAKDMLRYRFGLGPAGVPEEDAYTHARRLGVAASVKGSKYLHEALRLLQKNPNQQITKELYPAIAAKFHVSAQRVERCMRAAIHTAWEKRDESIWRMYFATDASGRVPRPSNAKFLAAILEKNQLVA